LKQLALSGTHADIQDAMMMVQDDDNFDETMTKMTDQSVLNDHFDNNVHNDNDDNDDMPPPEAMEAASPEPMHCKPTLIHPCNAVHLPDYG
jgi:hypothetical protein